MFENFEARPMMPATKIRPAVIQNTRIDRALTTAGNCGAAISGATERDMGLSVAAKSV